MKIIVSLLQAALVTASSTGAEKRASNSVVLEMSGHSFNPPLNFDNGLENWFVSGSSVALEDSVQLLAPVPRRSGFFVHKGKIESNHFLSTIELDSIPMKSTSTASKSNGLVGIWFSQGNYTGTVMKGLESNKADDWRDSMISVGFGLDGVLPPNFSGVGVVLSYSAGTITLITSDGSAGSPNYRLDTSKNTISNFDFRRPGVKITLSINRKRNGFHVYVFDSEKNRANLELDGIHTIPTSGFFGFAGYTGTSDTTYRVLIRQIKSVNLDLASGSGEAGPTEVGEKHKINLDELVHDDDDMLEDPLQQIKDLQKATSILSEYLADSRYRDSAMVRNLGDIQARAHSLQDAIDDLRAELRISFKAGAGSGKDLLGEVMSLKELVKIHSEENSSLEGFREDLKKLHEETTDETDSNVVQNIASANRELADEVSRANFTANLVIGIFGITVMGLGLVLFFKMRQYEKKHFL